MIPRTIGEFIARFESAKHGEEIVYFRGFLARARFQAQARFEGSLDVAELAYILGTPKGQPLRANYPGNNYTTEIQCGTGEAGLAQRRLSEDVYEYVIQKV